MTSFRHGCSVLISFQLSPFPSLFLSTHRRVLGHQVCDDHVLHGNAIAAIGSQTSIKQTSDWSHSCSCSGWRHRAQLIGSDSALVVVQKPLNESIRFLAVLWGQPTQKDKEALGCPVLSFDEVAEKGRQNLTGSEANPVQISGSDLATLVYTSGTTGNPKVIAYCHDRLLWCSAQILDHTIAMHVAVCVRVCVRACAKSCS